MRSLTTYVLRVLPLITLAHGNTTISLTELMPPWVADAKDIPTVFIPAIVNPAEPSLFLVAVCTTSAIRYSCTPVRLSVGFSTLFST